MREYIDKMIVLREMSLLKDAVNPFQVVKNFPAAQVIPYMNCQNLTKKKPSDEFVCSHCGAIFRDVALCKINENGDECYSKFEFSFCPKCGAMCDVEGQ